ncbi:MAG: hypothetical protein RLZZ116_2386 [Planctomycetota bacterium]|jgi:Transport and Golgi organisation 2
MCTLSIIVTALGEFTLGFNRDEKPRRDEGAPTTRGARRSYIAPIDLASGGTWIAVNDAGIAFALLNRSEPRVGDAAAGLSRGRIVPSVAECGDFAEIERELRAIASAFSRGFVFVATDGHSVLEGVGTGGRVEIAVSPLHRPFMRASSGLGDHLVQPPRAELFEARVAAAEAVSLPEAQRDFHAHCWGDRRHLSVLMDRGEARTVSQTFVRVDRARVELVHALRVGEGFAAASTHGLARA